MNQNITTGTFEFTSNKDHVYIQGTEENDIELLSLKGNSEINKNSCTYDRFREGLAMEFPFLVDDSCCKHVAVIGTRFMYDSHGLIHQDITIKQDSTDGLYNTLPANLESNNTIIVKIKIHKNDLEASDTAKISFINFDWDIKNLPIGEHSKAVKMTNQSDRWLPVSWSRPQFLNIVISNATEKNKRYDFEILEISASDAEGIKSMYNEIQSLEADKITIQEGALETFDSYIINNDFASRYNIVNKRILDIQKEFL